MIARLFKYLGRTPSEVRKKLIRLAEIASVLVRLDSEGITGSSTTLPTVS
jgi:hypothetical protein